MKRREGLCTYYIVVKEEEGEEGGGGQARSGKLVSPPPSLISARDKLYELIRAINSSLIYGCLPTQTPLLC